MGNTTSKLVMVGLVLGAGFVLRGTYEQIIYPSKPTVAQADQYAAPASALKNRRRSSSTATPATLTSRIPTATEEPVITTPLRHQRQRSGQQRIAQHCGANQHTAGQAFGQRVTKR
jgi:hypothetical protein